MSETLNLPAEIDRIHGQLNAARDLETVREIHDRAEALRVYCQKHDGLLEAHNRLAGVIALCERRIGQELRATPKNTGARGVGTSAVEKDDRTPPTLAELGISKDESAAYQDMAAVEEEVILDAIATAGAGGREVTKRDIWHAVRERLGKAPRPSTPPPDPELEADLKAAGEEWEAGRATRELWSPVMDTLEEIARLPAPADLFAAYHEPLDFALRRAVPPALAWITAFKELWDGRQVVLAGSEPPRPAARRQRRQDSEDAA